MAFFPLMIYILSHHASMLNMGGFVNRETRFFDILKHYLYSLCMAFYDVCNR